MVGWLLEHSKLFFSQMANDIICSSLKESSTFTFMLLFTILTLSNEFVSLLMLFYLIHRNMFFLQDHTNLNKSSDYFLVICL